MIWKGRVFEYKFDNYSNIIKSFASEGSFEADRWDRWTYPPSTDHLIGIKCLVSVELSPSQFPESAPEETVKSGNLAELRCTIEDGVAKDCPERKMIQTKSKPSMCKMSSF